MKVWAFVLCLPLLAHAEFDGCSNFVEFPESGMSGYRSYRYTVDVDANCNGATLTCQAEFPTNEQLRDRSWYLTNNRESHGLLYPASFLQLYSIECPSDTFLHLFPQRLQTERRSTPGTTCNTEDFVQVRHTELEGGADIFCGTEEDISESEIFNGGLGRFLSDSDTRVEFCSNFNNDVGNTATNRSSLILNTPFNGFVLRATCVDPLNSYLPGCVDYQFIKDWDQDWLDLQNDPYEKPDRLSIPHKRSVENKVRKHRAKDKRMEKRFKRFITLQTFEFTEGQTVTYENGKFTFDFNNGSLPFCPNGQFFCLFANSDFFGSRRFYGDAPFVFTGPGNLELDTGIARLFYSVNTSDTALVQSLLLPGDEIMRMVNRIYEYIYNCWVFPYPVVDRTGTGFPLLRSDTVDIDLARQREGLESFGQVEATRYLGFLQEDFWPIADNPNSCFRGTLIRTAPVFGSTIPIRLYEFCGLFYYSCNPILRIACQELLRLK